MGLNTCSALMSHWLDLVEAMEPAQRARHFELARRLVAEKFDEATAGKLALEQLQLEDLERQVDQHGVPPIGSIRHSLAVFRGD